MQSAQAETPAAWAAGVQPGAMIVYFTGNLACAHHRSDLRRRANEWFVLAERGLVVLTQKRIATGCYEYRATRSSAAITDRQQLREAISSGREIVNAMIGAT